MAGIPDDRTLSLRHQHASEDLSTLADVLEAHGDLNTDDLRSAATHIAMRGSIQDAMGDGGQLPSDSGDDEAEMEPNRNDPERSILMLAGWLQSDLKRLAQHDRAQGAPEDEIEELLAVATHVRAVADALFNEPDVGAAVSPPAGQLKFRMPHRPVEGTTPGARVGPLDVAGARLEAALAARRGRR